MLSGSLPFKASFVVILQESIAYVEVLVCVSVGSSNERFSGTR